MIILTARDSVEDTVAGLDSGADDYMPKPFKFQELLAIELTARESALAETVFRHAGQILSREQLLSAVWGLDANIDRLRGFAWSRRAGQLASDDTGWSGSLVVPGPSSRSSKVSQTVSPSRSRQS